MDAVKNGGERMTKKITTIRLSIDCEKCKCFDQCLKLRKVLDSSLLSNNKLGR